MAIITKLEKTNKNKQELYNVYIDEEYCFPCHIEVIIKHSLSSGMEIDDKFLEQIIVESGERLAFQKSLNLLSKNIKTEKELIKYLKEKKFHDIVIENTIKKLKEYKYLNDEAYIKYYANINKNKKGIKKIKYELSMKGVDKALIDETIEEENDDKDALQKLIEKYLKGKELNIKTKTKCFSNMVSKGFEFDAINSILRNYDFTYNE